MRFHLDQYYLYLKLNDAELFINKILKIISNTTNINLKDMTINYSKKNYLFLEKRYYQINFDLINLNKIDDLEININIINPSKTYIISDKNDQISINKNIIYWKLTPGINNTIKFTYWYWNKFIIGTIIVLLLVIIAYYVRRNRFEIGSNLPKLPS